MNYPVISVIIPLWVAGDRFFRDLENFRRLDYPYFEVLVVSDWKVDLPGSPFRLILTGREKTGPAEKRDRAIDETRGTILAFIDDDAYPHPDWMKNAVRHFDNPQIAGVGGPGITPSEDSFRMRAGGGVYESIFGSGLINYRFQPVGSVCEVDDFPAYNLFLRKGVLKNIGGWGTTYYGGEDTKLCLEVVRAGGKILYDPDVVVYHHRRPLFGEHLRQIANVGLHRGYFVRRYGETSRRPLFFLPSIFTIGYLIFFGVSFLSNEMRNAFWIATALLLGLFFVSVPSRNPLIRGMAALGILFHHLTYGISFLRGLLTHELNR